MPWIAAVVLLRDRQCGIILPVYENVEQRIDEELIDEELGLTQNKDIKERTSVADAMIVLKGMTARTVHLLVSSFFALATKISVGSSTNTMSTLSVTTIFVPSASIIISMLALRPNRFRGNEQRKKVLPRKSISVPTSGSGVVWMPPTDSRISSASSVVWKDKDSPSPCQRLLGMEVDEINLW